MNMAAKPVTLGKLAEPYGTMPAPATVRIERILPGPVERVWSYLTDSDKRAKWLASGPMALQEGGAIRFIWRNSDLSAGQPNPNGGTSPNGVDHELDCIVLECEPPHLLSFTWGPEKNGAEVTFELSEQGPDTKMVLTHKRLPNRAQLLGVSSGWHVHVGILLDLLSDTTPRLFWPEHARMRKLYEERIPE